MSFNEQSTLKELLQAHKQIHKDWLNEQSTRLLHLHEQIVQLIETLGWKHSTPLLFEQRDTKGRIIFAGTRGYVEETDKFHKHYTHIIYQANWKPFIIDMGETWKGSKEVPDLPILITHAHPDHLFGLEGLDLRKRKVYMTNASIDSEYFQKEMEQDKLDNLQGPLFHRRGSFVLEGRRCISVPVLHSLKAPNVALFFTFCGKKICHVTDVLSIPRAYREEYLKNVDIYIGDGSSLRQTLIRFKKQTGRKGKPYGHASAKRQLQWCRDANVKCVVFTHFGSRPIKMNEDDLIAEVQKIANKVGYKGQVCIARDGSYITLPAMKWVAEAHSLRALEAQGEIEEFLEATKALVEIKSLKDYDPTKPDDAQLGDDWRILLAWYSNYYAPKAPKKGQKFKYSKELILEKAIAIAKEMIRRGFTFDLPKNYKPGARDLFIKVINAIGLKKFKWKAKAKVEFMWEVQKELPGRYLQEPYAKLLWKGEKTLIVATRPYRKYADKPLYLIGDKAYGIGKHSEPDGPHLADKVRVELRKKHQIRDEDWKRWWPGVDKVYLFTWEWVKKFKEPKDYVRLKGPQAYYRKVTLVEEITEAMADDLIKKYVDSSKWEKMKVEPKEKLMNKRQFLEPPYPFSPTKTSKKGYRELELFEKRSIAKLAKEWLAEHPGEQIWVEVKFDGMRVTGHKKGKETRIWSEGGERLDDNLPTLKAELAKIKADSFILDAEVVPFDKEGNPMGRRAAMKAMGKGKVDDTRWIAHVFDLLYLNGKDLHKKPYQERRKLLRGLELHRGDVPKHFTVHWLENIPREATTPKAVIKAVNEVSAMKGSEGAMLKLSGSDYPITKRTPSWAKYKKAFDIDVMIVHKFPKTHKKGPKKGQPIEGQDNLAGVIGPVKPPKEAKIHDIDQVFSKVRSQENYKQWKNHKIQYLKYKGKVWSNIGITMSTAEDVKIGDIVRCTVRLIRKLNSTEYHWLIARVLEPRPEKTKPDPVETAAAIAKVSQYRVKSMLEKSKVDIDGEEYYDLEEFVSLWETKEVGELLEGFIDEEIREELITEEDSYMTVPDENKKWEFDCQAHIRGASVHL